MKLEKLNLRGKGELLNDFDLKNIRGGYFQNGTCSGVPNMYPNAVCNGDCSEKPGYRCMNWQYPGGGIVCACVDRW